MTPSDSGVMPIKQRVSLCSRRSNELVGLVSREMVSDDRLQLHVLCHQVVGEIKTSGFDVGVIAAQTLIPTSRRTAMHSSQIPWLVPFSSLCGLGSMTNQRPPTS